MSIFNQRPRYRIRQVEPYKWLFEKRRFNLFWYAGMFDYELTELRAQRSIEQIIEEWESWQRPFKAPYEWPPNE